MVKIAQAICWSVSESYYFSADVIGDGVLKGKKVKINGETYLDFTDLKLSLDISNYNVRLENLFNGNKQLGLYIYF